MSRGLIALDFDGPVNSYVSGWKGPRCIPDDPVPGALEFMLALLTDGFDVGIHSSRAAHWGGKRAMQRWLRKHADALWHDSPAGPGLERVQFFSYKPPAKLLIDDRAMQFSGQWPTLAEVRTFRPWSLKDVLTVDPSGEVAPVELIDVWPKVWPEQVKRPKKS